MDTRHPHSLRFSFGVLVALLALTAVTFVSARELDAFVPAAARVPIALVIATLKGALVVWFFMHLGQHAATSRAYLAAALVLLTLMIGMIVADAATRLPTTNPNWPGFAEKRGGW
jgi:cytochrome c oxidase subunit IV